MTCFNKKHVSLLSLIILVTELWETPITVAICLCDLEIWLYKAIIWERTSIGISLLLPIGKY